MAPLFNATIVMVLLLIEFILYTRQQNTIDCGDVTDYNTWKEIVCFWLYIDFVLISFTLINFITRWEKTGKTKTKYNYLIYRSFLSCSSDEAEGLSFTFSHSFGDTRRTLNKKKHTEKENCKPTFWIDCVEPILLGITLCTRDALLSKAFAIVMMIWQRGFLLGCDRPNHVRAIGIVCCWTCFSREFFYFFFQLKHCFC